MITERISYLSNVFRELALTSSMVEKRHIVNTIADEYVDDFNACIEALNGKYVFGYKFYKANDVTMGEDIVYFMTVREALDYMLTPMLSHNLSDANIHYMMIQMAPYADFFEPIVNRTMKLGIGKSIMDKAIYAPMLAKKFEGINKNNTIFYVTEKLDGNRCIAYFDTEWHFVSRNGKPMYVNFDMTGLPTAFIYDGEILSREQVEMSECIANKNYEAKFSKHFNSTSGLINTHKYNKDLIYNIFDIMTPEGYALRRDTLDTLHPLGRDVRILPILTITNDTNKINELLDKVTSVGGEGIMLNDANGIYTHKRTNSILKYKQVQTMDMRVVDIYDGNGKYIGVTGGLKCCAILENGKTVTCDVGSGLSDNQRLRWMLHPEEIINKIVEVAYFEICQNKDNSGTNVYSLRFPRLKKIREDKVNTSTY